MARKLPISDDQGLGVTHYTWSEAKTSLSERLTGDRPTQVVTLTPEMCVRASREPDFMEVIFHAGIVVADGVGVTWGEGRLTGRKPEKIPGIEFGEWALAEVARIKGSVFLLGSKADVVEKTSEELPVKFPGLSVAGFRDGYFEQGDVGEVVKQVADTCPDLLLVGMGSPRQEFFIADNLGKLDCRVAIGIGGSFDVWSGHVQRAPDIFQKTGTEWLYRTTTQPGQRMGRVPMLWQFVRMVLRG